MSTASSSTLLATGGYVEASTIVALIQASDISPPPKTSPSQIASQVIRSGHIYVAHSAGGIVIVHRLVDDEKFV
jgi:hypothetical protein